MSRGQVMREDDLRIACRPPVERVLARLRPGATDACWNWPGATNGVGYGVIGRGGKRGSNCYVHRVMYEHTNGLIPDGLVLDHLCRNRLCANPAHLQPVTHRVNILRGVGPSAMAAARDACPSGHPYDLANTYLYADGSRSCRACAREYQRARRLREKEAS